MKRLLIPHAQPFHNCLLVCIFIAYQHGKFNPAGIDGSQDGIEEIEDTNQRNDNTEASAHDKKHITVICHVIFLLLQKVHFHPRTLRRLSKSGPPASFAPGLFEDCLPEVSVASAPSC